MHVPSLFGRSKVAKEILPGIFVNPNYEEASTLIRASVSESHTSELNGGIFHIYIYIYIYTSVDARHLGVSLSER